MNNEVSRIRGACGVLLAVGLLGCSGEERGNSVNGVPDSGTTLDMSGDAAAPNSETKDGGVGFDTGTADVGTDIGTDTGDPVAATVRIVGVSGQQACTEDPGVLYRTFYNASINVNKQVVFNADLTGTGVDTGNDTVVCAGSASGSARAVAREGDATPGLAGETFDSLVGTAYYIDEDDHVHLLAPYLLPQEGALWSEVPGGTLALVAAYDGPAVGRAAGVTFRPQSTIADGGESIFRWNVTGPGVNSGNDAGIWRGTPGAVQLLLSEGDQAPGLTGVVFSELIDYAVSRAGELVFGAQLSGTGINALNAQSIWRRSSAGVLAIAYQTDDNAPGASGGTFTGSFGEISINAAGEIAFVGKHSNGGAGNAIWAESGTTLGLVAQTGEMAPGTAGAMFGTLGKPAIDSNGDVAFLATLQMGGAVATTNDTALFAQRGGVVSLVAREGDPAPGFPGGVTLGDVNTWAVTQSLAGNLAFIAHVDGNTPPGSSGLWVENSGAIVPVLLPGEVVEVAPGDLRDVYDVSMLQGQASRVSPGDGGRPMTLHDDGEVVLVATLSQNSQALVVVDTTP